MTDFLLKEDGFYVLKEDGFKIILDRLPVSQFTQSLDLQYTLDQVGGSRNKPTSRYEFPMNISIGIK